MVCVMLVEKVVQSITRKHAIGTVEIASLQVILAVMWTVQVSLAMVCVMVETPKSADGTMEIAMISMKRILAALWTIQVSLAMVIVMLHRITQKHANGTVEIAYISMQRILAAL